MVAQSFAATGNWPVLSCARLPSWPAETPWRYRLWPSGIPAGALRISPERVAYPPEPFCPSAFPDPTAARGTRKRPPLKERMMMQGQAGQHLNEDRRREIFLALVDAQDP